MTSNKPSRETGRLSVRTVLTAKPRPGKQGAVKRLLHDGGGLYLQVTETGAKSWLYRYATGTGKKRQEYWLGLGPASTSSNDGRVSLADARQRAAECRRLRWEGKDPLVEREAARAAAQLERSKAVTFRSAAEQFIGSHQAGWRNEKHGKQWGATLERYVYPMFGDLAVQDVDVGLVLKAVEPIWTIKPETASRVRGRVESILDWAAARGYRRGDNPARWRGHLENLLPARAKVAKVEHHPALPYTEIGAFLKDIRDQEGMAAEALELTILTCARTGEIIGAKPEEFNVDEKLWTVPAERMKAGREHRVPLSAAAVAIVKKRLEAAGVYLFPGGKKGKPLSNMAMLKLLERMDRDDLTVHGFRSTFRDWAAERTNFPREVAEMALAHTIPDAVERAYRRGDLFEKRRQMMKAWAEWCGRPAPNGAKIASIGTRLRGLEQSVV